MGLPPKFLRDDSLSAIILFLGHFTIKLSTVIIPFTYYPTLPLWVSFIGVTQRHVDFIPISMVLRNLA